MNARAARSWRVPAALLLACSFLLAPLLYVGYFQPHSGFLPVYTLYAWEAAGHPLPDVAAYSPTGSLGGDGLLPYALAALLRLLGADGGTAVKAVFGAAVLLAAVGAYRLVRRRPAVDPPAALALALVWAGSPMVLASVYARGSLGGALALGLLPWLAGAIEKDGEPAGRTSRFAALSVPVLSALAHPGFTLLAGAALAAVSASQGRRLRSWPLAALGAFGLAGVVFGSGPSPSLQFSRPYQWLTQSVGYAAHSDPWGPGTPAPMALGFLPLGVFVASRLTAPLDGRARRAIAVTLAAVLILLLLSTDPARALWQSALAAVLDGPWQMVALASFLLVWAAAPALPALLCGRGAPAAGLAVLAVALAAPFLDAPLTTVTPAACPLAAFADGRILLVGAELEGPLRHGATPRLRLYWQATEPLSRDYTVFVHVVDDGDTKWGQRDSWPADGQRPTSSWRPGEIVTDEHPVYIDVQGPVDGYRLLVGLYDLETGERLYLSDGSTALELASHE